MGPNAEPFAMNAAQWEECLEALDGIEQALDRVGRQLGAIAPKAHTDWIVQFTVQLVTRGDVTPPEGEGWEMLDWQIAPVVAHAESAVAMTPGTPQGPPIPIVVIRWGHRVRG